MPLWIRIYRHLCFYLRTLEFRASCSVVFAGYCPIPHLWLRLVAMPLERLPIPASRKSRHFVPCAFFARHEPVADRVFNRPRRMQFERPAFIIEPRADMPAACRTLQIVPSNGSDQSPTVRHSTATLRRNAVCFAHVFHAHFVGLTFSPIGDRPLSSSALCCTQRMRGYVLIDGLGAHHGRNSLLLCSVALSPSVAASSPNLNAKNIPLDSMLLNPLLSGAGRISVIILADNCMGNVMTSFVDPPIFE